MKSIDYKTLVQRVAALCMKAAYNLPQDVLTAIEEALIIEQSEFGKEFLSQYLLNAKIAYNESMPICQDTGTAVYFVYMGENVRVTGGGLVQALQEATAAAYCQGYLRKSIVADPLFNRQNTGDNTPAIINFQLVPGDKLKIIIVPKGGGAENMSAIKMFSPSASRQDIIDFVTNTVVNSGGNPCPPTIVGVGIGGNFEKVALLAKTALLRQVGQNNSNPDYAALECDMLTSINRSGVGPQGLGGRITAFAVHIEYFPCHIASLPVAVNLNCHAARHAEMEL
jgi:fumarate hydratase subunit alpha